MEKTSEGREGMSHTRRKAYEGTFPTAQESLWGGAGTLHHLRAFSGCLLRKSTWEDLVGLQEQV